MHTFAMAPIPPAPKSLEAFLDALPIDGEPLTPEELERHRRGAEEAASGETLTTEELLRALADDASGSES